MKRRDFFKNIAAVIGGTVIAPLAKLLPDTRTEQRKAITVWDRPFLVGSTIRIRMPQRYVVHDYLTAGNEAVESLRREMEKDTSFMAGERWS